MQHPIRPPAPPPSSSRVPHWGGCTRLVPAVPTDPFDGQPLRYLRTNKGVAIYSIGRDQTDDGGQLDPVNQRRSPDDGFRLLDAELRLSASP